MVPTLFVSHGSPMVAVTEDAYADALRALGARLPRPRGVVVVSAHGLTPDGGVVVSAGDRPRLIYDFGGFPDELYRIAYPCPGDPALASEVAARLAPAGLEVTPDRDAGLDHGVWVPLLRLFPAADVPVVQVSMPYPSPPRTLFRMGESLRPLRDAGVLLVGSGGAVHNLARLNWHQKTSAPDRWAAEFSAWLKGAVERKAFDEVLDFAHAAPHARLAHPTPDHFYPVFFTLGAVRERDHVETVVDEFQYGCLSMYSFAAGLR
jgi:4,5-DOPA dioxygenase extradiol